ncbi:heat-inducible transcriptional repressor HrcA [Ilumatobacter coccineus]|uniref:Heat-inducible transcription repressor HrcA n=1 Tax=Ilumatobacter coccineus (strain NBRC 103263 / KCTC 29153 / YM16-304) TaxID=1313172 RepID=A0A6C7EBC0_ILUCY|nr:heat-inducible transcriptional repressor HrcA [Ilumatobacter coccineus]BAN02425.1 heat-inducible transcription repressor HrcA [Ilumatobacter coccineus YM16-304]
MKTMLDDRKTAILAAVVQEYIATAQPVGSGSIVRSEVVNVSSATVRSELAVLEAEGYLVQPHTSAGRIPTDRGYRYFVDNLTKPGRLAEPVQKQVGEFFSAAHGRIEEMLHQTSNLLAELTHSAAVVVGPRAEAVAVRRVTLVGLSESLATVVVVFANGSVENVSLELEPGDDEARQNAVSAHLSSQLDGTLLGEISELASSGDPEVDRLSAAALAQIQTVAATDHVYTGGVSEVAKAFDAVDVVRSVLHTLEQQFVVVSLVSDIVNRGMSVAIGVEHGVEPLSACSVVVSPVVVDGEHLGSVGVLGPTRMNYPQALATVDVVSSELGHRIEEG